MRATGCPLATHHPVLFTPTRSQTNPTTNLSPSRARDDRRHHTIRRHGQGPDATTKGRTPRLNTAPPQCPPAVLPATAYLLTASLTASRWLTPLRLHHLAASTAPPPRRLAAPLRRQSAALPSHRRAASPLRHPTAAPPHRRAASPSHRFAVPSPSPPQPGQHWPWGRSASVPVSTASPHRHSPGR